LAGILPGGTPADASFAATGALKFSYTPHAVSDGSDGHTRIEFTQPTNEFGQTRTQVEELGLPPYPFNIFALLPFYTAETGNLFQRIAGAETI
jgi:hypothetical protein